VPTEAHLAPLAGMLNLMRGHVRGWQGPVPRDLAQCLQVEWALRLLAEKLPGHRERYVDATRPSPYSDADYSPAVLEMIRRDEREVEQRFGGSLPAPQEQLAAFDAVVVAAQDALRLGLPMYPPAMLGQPATTWRDVALTLRQLLIAPDVPWSVRLKHRKPDGVYDAIAALIPELTGENPTGEDIRKHLHSSPSNRARRSVLEIVKSWAKQGRKPTR
jgi:hypothetical protein